MAKAIDKDTFTATIGRTIVDRISERKEVFIVAAIAVVVLALVISYEGFRRYSEPYDVSGRISSAAAARDEGGLEDLLEEYRDTRYEPLVAYELALLIINRVDPPREYDRYSRPPLDEDEDDEFTDEEKRDAYSRACGLLTDIVERHEDNFTFIFINQLLGVCEKNHDYFSDRILDRETALERAEEDEKIEKILEEEEKERNKADEGAEEGGEDGGEDGAEEGGEDGVEDGAEDGELR